MAYLLALDQGTTSSRAILFRKDGTIKGVAQREFEQIFPQPGWVEHDAEEIWTTQISTATEVLSRARVRPREIAGVGITNQRETTVLWDRKSGRPIHHAIVWQDRRTASLCDQLRREGRAGMIQQKTGLILDAYFSGTKLHWLLENVEGARARAEKGELAFGTIDSWLLWKLSGGRLHLTDVSNASRTMLFNIRTMQWDSELLEMLRIPESLLPEVRSCSEIYGETDPDLFASSIPLAGIAGDQQAALFGQMCTRPGMAKNTYGTGCFMLMNTGKEAAVSEHNLLSTVGWKNEGGTHYALEGSVFIGGAVVQWLRDGLGIIRSSAEIENLALSVHDNGGVYVVPAFAGLGAPHWDPYARGLIAGLSRGSTAGHIARAALESIAYQVADVLDAMQADAGMNLPELRVDGGASANDLLMQFQADLIQAPVVRPKIIETTALGAAYHAGLAVGFWKKPEEIAEQWQVDRRFEPQMAESDARRLRERWLDALQRAKFWEKDENTGPKESP